MRAPKYKVVLTLGKFLFEEVHRYVGEYINPFTSGPAVSLRQCMRALGIWATEHTRAYNALPKPEWIKYLV